MNYEGLESQSTSRFKGTSSTDTHTSPTNHHTSKSFPFLFFCYRLYMFTSSHDFEVKSVHFRGRGLHFVIKLKIGKIAHLKGPWHHASKSFPSLFYFFCYRLYMFTSSHDFEVKSVLFLVNGLHIVIKFFSNCAFTKPLTSTFCEKRELFEVKIGHKNLPIFYFLLFDITYIVHM